ncbi:MAG: surface antigen precursor, partial [Segetibacter sp.]|nr:surface antigen precursor [Segetibacter sp.]
FDRIFLNELSEDDWKKQISYVQTILTDNLIKTAVRKLPDTIYALSGKKIISTLIARRSMLRKEALKYFRFLAKKADVHASDKEEFFKIDHKNNGDVGVSIYKIKEKGGVDRLLYSRIFDHHYTKDIRLYGLGGNDIFTITGTAKSPIKVRMVGGDNIDSFYVNENLHDKRKLYIYDRSDQDNILPLRSLVRNKTSRDSTVNAYDKHNFKYDKLGPLVSLVYSVDQRTMLRAGVVYEKHGFRKEPFAEKHLLSANYATSRHSFMFEYSAYLTKVIKNNDLRIDLVSRGPKNVSNFFGIGNETEFVNTEGKEIQYYRNRYDLLSADVRLQRHMNKSFTINAGLSAEYYTSSPSNNSTRFFQEYNAKYPGENIFSKRLYAGMVAGASVDTRNNGLFSSSGIFWDTEISAMNQLNGNRKTYGQIVSEFNFYIPLSKDSNIVIANRLGGGTTVGSPVFFQQMQLGGIRNLRGFHTYRFTGKTMFFHNADLRFKLFDFTSYLFPGTIGIVGFNDIGRVWVPGESSNKWHHGYGGGIYIIPAELILIQAVVGHSVEGTLPFISVGFTF